MNWPDTDDGALVLTSAGAVDRGALVVTAVGAVEGGALVAAVDGGGEDVLVELAGVQAASATATAAHSADM